MKIISDIGQATEQINLLKSSGKTTALVPTMGNLHSGHLSLVKIAQQIADVVIVSIFVNPMQFGQNEDFNTYPRTLEKDCKALIKNNVDILFNPNSQDIYPKDKAEHTQIILPSLSHKLCGEFRPNFFIGVATIVAKLFNIIPADFAVFGKKDYQQLLVIKKMVADLNLPIKILSGDIVRENNGLALSSRNSYLSANERKKAVKLYQVLQDAVLQLKQNPIAIVETTSIKKLNDAGFKVDYFKVLDANLSNKESPKIILVAAWLGKTRLIDNIEFS